MRTILHKSLIFKEEKSFKGSVSLSTILQLAPDLILYSLRFRDSRHGKCVGQWLHPPGPL